jgi:hypothetical protein
LSSAQIQRAFTTIESIDTLGNVRQLIQALSPHA